MSLATIDQIADAVVSDLNVSTFSMDFQTERVPIVLFDVADLDTSLHVKVIGSTDDGSISDVRDETSHEYTAMVVVFKRVEAITNAEIDPLKFLCEEIGFYWKDKPLGGGSRVERWTETQVVPNPADRLKQEMLFISVIKLTFWGTRE